MWQYTSVTLFTEDGSCDTKKRRTASFGTKWSRKHEGKGNLQNIESVITTVVHDNRLYRTTYEIELQRWTIWDFIALFTL